MSRFRVVLVEHGYSSSKYEKGIIEAAGGEFIDADTMPLTEALKLCEHADGILVRRLQVTRDILQRFRRCKILVRYGVGTDNVDTQAATDCGIIVGHVPTYCIDEVSTHAFALLLACIRAIPQTHSRVIEGSWEVKRTVRIERSSGKIVGIVGLGQIGRAFARKCHGWGWRLIGVDPFIDADKVQALDVQLVDFPTLLRKSDYISIHVPLLPETHHLFDAKAFTQMKKGSILVNTARGPVIDLAALPAALDAGRPMLAGLDVFEEEPLPSASPLCRDPRIILTDHTAWYSEQSQVDLQTRAAEEIARVCTGGLPLSLMNPEVLAKLGREKEFTVPETMLWQMRRLRRNAD